MKIKMRFCEVGNRVVFNISEKDLLLSYKFTEGFADSKPDYAGSYKVVSSFTEQKLPTKDKSMNDDVTIYGIPFSEVTNIFNGITVTIGV